MTGAVEQAPGLLHNTGYAPQASILWRGIGRGPLADEAERIEVARRCGSWLHLSLSIGKADARFHRDWNSAVALLRLLEPEHHMGEAAATRRLTDLIEACTERLDWPRCLMVGNTVGKPGGNREQRITLDHAPTTFVALAKSTGSLWLRDRTPRLAPLHAPNLVGPTHTTMQSMRWSQLLWFPDGIPESLLSQALAQLPLRKPARPNPIG